MCQPHRLFEYPGSPNETGLAAVGSCLPPKWHPFQFKSNSICTALPLTKAMPSALYREMECNFGQSLSLALVGSGSPALASFLAFSLLLSQAARSPMEVALLCCEVLDENTVPALL